MRHHPILFGNEMMQIHLRFGKGAVHGGLRGFEGCDANLLDHFPTIFVDMIDKIGLHQFVDQVKIAAHDHFGEHPAKGCFVLFRHRSPVD